MKISIKKIDEVLPQIQCQKCGYNDCFSYAKAILEEGIQINKCNPGGNKVIEELAKILNQEKTVNLSYEQIKYFNIASINEEKCIGCTICIDQCPMDSIMGANKKMHTVINEYCSGCELCIDKCPMDCIQLESSNRPWTKKDADTARNRYKNHIERIRKNCQKLSLMKNKFL